MNNDSTYLSEIFSSLRMYKAYDYDTLYQCDNLVQKIIALYPSEAYSTGFKIQSNSSTIYESVLNRLGVWELFRSASIWARLHGLCCILIGAPGALDTPLDSGVEFLKLYALNNNTDISAEFIQVGSERVHKSRLLFFKGRELLRNFGEIKAVYCSILDGVIEVLEQFQKIPAVAMKLIRTSNQVALGTAGLGASIRSDIVTKQTTAREQIASRLNSLNAGRDVSEVVLFDKDNEIIQNTSLSLSGIEELIKVLENQLSLRTDYPKSVLFGESHTGGIGSGEVAQLIERMIWATKLSGWIDENWTTQLEKLCEALRVSLSLSPFTVTVPLSLILSPLEIAEINKNQVAVLDGILKFYPLEGEMLREYIVNNFTSLYLPALNKANQTDSIVDDLTGLLAINDRVVDGVMERVANA